MPTRTAAKSAAKPAPSPSAELQPKRSFQDLIFALQRFWAEQGCVILQPYDMEVGAGTFHPATTLRALGPKPWNACYVQPSRRPKDGRYGENPNRLQHYYQLQVIMKPAPDNILDLYLESLRRIGLTPELHDIRFVEDDWESPTLGAWGLGWEVWCDGMEVTQFTYFQQVGGFDCEVVSAEITYGLERLAMYVQGVDRVFDLSFNGREDARSSATATSSCRPSRNIRASTSSMPTPRSFCSTSRMRKQSAKRCWRRAARTRATRWRCPAYDQCIKASHIFNLLDARGVISVTERQSYILRVRELAKACCAAWLKTVGGGA